MLEPRTVPAARAAAASKAIRIPIDWGGVQPIAGRRPSTGAASTPIVEARGEGRASRCCRSSPARRPGPCPQQRAGRGRRSKRPAHLPVSGAAAHRPGRPSSKPRSPATARTAASGPSNPRVPKRPIRTWQIWNEPNFKYFVAKPNPAEYGQLVKLSYDGAESGRPGRAGRSSPACSPGRRAAAMPNGKHEEPQLVARDFLEQMYKTTPGIKTKFSGVALHPYTATLPANCRRRSKNSATSSTANKDAAKGLWITELGWSSQPPQSRGQPLRQGPGRPGARAAGRLHAAQRNKQAKWKLKRVYWFSVDDAGRHLQLLRRLRPLRPRLRAEEVLVRIREVRRRHP